MSESKRLIFTVIAVSLLAILTGLFLGGALIPSPQDGLQQYDKGVIITERQSFVVHAHDNLSSHEHKITTTLTITETTPHGYLHDFATTVASGMTIAQTVSTVAQGANEVWINNNEVLPQSITVPVGTTVTWTNKDNSEHTVTFDNGLINMRLISRGAFFNYTFTEVGTFTFYCEPHPGMRGRVIVK